MKIFLDFFPLSFFFLFCFLLFLFCSLLCSFDVFFSCFLSFLFLLFFYLFSYVFFSIQCRISFAFLFKAYASRNVQPSTRIVLPINTHTPSLSTFQHEGIRLDIWESGSNNQKTNSKNTPAPGKL